MALDNPMPYLATRGQRSAVVNSSCQQSCVPPGAQGESVLAYFNFSLWLFLALGDHSVLASPPHPLWPGLFSLLL